MTGNPARPRGLTRSTQQRLRLLLSIVVVSTVAGAIYGALQTGEGNHVWFWHGTLGAIIGATISSSLFGFELFVARRLFGGGRRLPFALAILVRTIGFGAVIVGALLVIPWLLLGTTPTLSRPGFVGDAVFSMALAFIFVCVMAVTQLIGPRVLVNLLTGRYYRPRQEQRIVLFLDLVDSTAIAERTGNVGFHALLSDVFTRLSHVVTDFGGEVHRYVGDMLIATWPVGSPRDNARPIECLFACRDTLQAASVEFMARHGHVPDFRAGLHLGPLVAGEIGGFKQEITFIGDAMNTAARIEQACRSTGHALLASKPLMERAALPAGIVATGVGSHALRGKNEPLELFALERGAA